MLTSLNKFNIIHILADLKKLFKVSLKNSLMEVKVSGGIYIPVCEYQLWCLSSQKFVITFGFYQSQREKSIFPFVFHFSSWLFKKEILGLMFKKRFGRMGCHRVCTTSNSHSTTQIYWLQEENSEVKHIAVDFLSTLLPKLWDDTKKMVLYLR